MPTDQDQVRAQAQAKIEREIVAELGTRQAAGLKENAPSRIVGVLVRNGDDWDRAFEHIAEHFRVDPTKPSHALFLPKYRSRENLRQLLLKAARKPSEVHLTKLKVQGGHLGKPAVEVVRDFAESIGDNEEHRRLRMFIDFQGNLITAYPGPVGEGKR